MRLSRSTTLAALAAALSLALAACAPSQPPAAADATPAVDEAAIADEAPATDADRAPALEDELIVSTNEPFWQARTDGETLTLTGIDGQRVLQIATSDLSEDGRTVVATDADGQVEIKVTDGMCHDSMSGAMFPFGATLAIDGGTAVAGCARPAWMPPPGEPM